VRLAVVVPVRDESLLLPACLDSLSEFRTAGDPVVVVDNGSRDATAAIARERGFETLDEPRPGRGRAVASGYRAVRDRASWVLVIHADMVVAAGSRDALAAALAGSPQAVVGSFGHLIADKRLVFRAIESGNRLRARAFGVPYGDQAQFFSVAAVEATGGFPDIERCEDLEVALRLRRIGTVLYLDRPVTIPSRHWERSIVRTTLSNWRIAARFALSSDRKRSRALDSLD
jgi:glycosyltransferase involved in cell wall biosynthesis